MRVIRSKAGSVCARRAARRRRYLHILVLVLATHATACWEWRPATVPPAHLLSREAPGRIRVTVHEGTSVVVYDPTVSGDSIRGSAMGQPATIAITEVERLETRELSARKTIVVAVLTGIVGYALVTACFGLVSPC